MDKYVVIVSALSGSVDKCLRIVEGTDMIPIQIRIKDFNMPEGASALVYAKARGMAARVQTATINGNAVEFTPNKRFFVQGENVMQGRITKDGKDLITFAVFVICKKSIVTDDAEETSSDPTLLQQLLDEIEDLSQGWQSHGKVITQKIYHFDNVADMQRYNLKEGDVCITLGYYLANDGGGTTYNVAATQSDYYETLNNGLYANQIADTNNVVNALTIGFHRNDDVVNDEIYAKYADIYKHLYFPRGRYKFNDTIYMTGRQEVTGCTNPFLGSTTDRFYGTIFDFTNIAESSKHCIDMFGTGDTTKSNGAMLRGISLYADTLISTQNRDNAFTDTPMLAFTVSRDLSGIRTSNSAKIDNCCFIGFGKAGVFQDLCGFTTITNCQFFKCNYGAVLHTDNIVDNVRGYFCNIGVYCRSLNMMSNIRFDSVKKGALIEGNACTITGLAVDYSDEEGLYISGDANTVVASFYRVGMCNNDAGVGAGRHKVFVNTGKGNNLNISCKEHITLDNGDAGYSLPKHVRFNTGVSNVNINLSDDSDDALTIDKFKKKFFFGKDNTINVNYNGTPILFKNVSYDGLTTDNVKNVSYDGTVPNLLKIKSFTADKTSPQTQGTTVQFTAEAEGGEGTLQYRFRRVDNSGTESVFRDYSAGNAAYCNPSEIGAYTIYVDVKDEAGNVVTKSVEYEWTN